MDNKEKYKEILASTAGRIVLKAGPGSGKTSGVMLPKARLLLASPTINPSEVLLLSFSRIAALDLKEKAKGIDKTPYATTVHSLCLSFLMSENDHSIRHRISSILMLDAEKDALLADLKVIFPRQNKHALRKLLTQFSAAWSEQPEDEIFEEDDDKKAFKRAVMNWLSEHEAAMMEEIAYHAVNLGKTLPDANFFQNKKHIFVDEFQDLNKLEQEFIAIASAKADTLIVMGDPDQSIYSFKFAHPKGMDDFAGKFSEVETHTLEYTGRSAKSIVTAANHLLRQADPTREKLLQPLPDKEEGEVHFVKRSTQAEEFDYVLGKIKTLIEDGTAPADILVLSPKKDLGHVFVNHTKDSQSGENPVEFVFLQKKEFSLEQTERIILLGLAVNPSSLLQTRTLLGLGDHEHFANELVTLKAKYGNLQEVVSNAKVDDFLPKQKRLRALCQRIADLREFLEAHVGKQDVQPIIDELFPEDNDELKEIRAMLLNLYEENEPLESLYAKFTDNIRVLPSPPEVVRIMTPLASKGLEADHVFIIGCNDGNIPGERHSDHLSDHEHEQEQRRLLYVAFTRAKKTLTVSWSQNIPFAQALRQNTASTATRRRSGQTVSQVGVCRFLLDLGTITWE